MSGPTGLLKLKIRSGGVLNILQAADHLQVTERTLRCRLVTESTSFRTIFDEVRNVLAQKYLSSTSLKVNEIVHLLNYSERANFR
jgi:AraC-like DNA-binding protein